MKITNNKKVVLGMSGGVDSTAAALLLLEEGYEVNGLFFDVFGKDKTAAIKAETAAARINIPFIYKDISKDFNSKIVTYFYNEYISGRTPNPCVLCNKEIKYRVLLEEADRIGAFHISTGHYADTGSLDGNEILIRICSNTKKDQSYVLWKLNQNELKRIIFPLSKINDKEEIRNLLRNKGFENAEAKDSQEICFIENDDYISFLTQKMGLKPKTGDFVNKDGEIIGKHSGIINYTIGQRKGLGMTFGKPVFVTEIDPENNRVVLGGNSDLFKSRVTSTLNNFSTSKNFFDMPLKGKIRYSSNLAECKIQQIDKDIVETVFEQPQRAPTPGQSIVWYYKDYLIGGGIIT